MRKTIVNLTLCALLFGLLFSGCTNTASPAPTPPAATDAAVTNTVENTQQPQQTEPQQTQPQQTESAQTAPVRPPQLHNELEGVWVNAGEYSEGRDFVETLTIRSDYTIRVHLDYQGKAYNDLAGTYLLVGKTLTFTLADGTVRVYDYELDGTVLTLVGEDRTVIYRRSD